jgi:hypothetical protein
LARDSADAAAFAEAQRLNEALVASAEHATGEHDTSAAMAEAHDGHPLDGTPVLSEDWLPPVSKQDGVTAAFSAADFPHEILPPSHPEVKRRIAAIDEALFQLDLIKAGVVPPDFAADPEAAVAAIKTALPDPTSFRAGSLSQYYHVWAHLLKPYAHRRQVKWVLRSIKEGVRWSMVKPNSQVTMPQHKAKMARAARMLGAQFSPEDVTAALSSAEPQAVQFPNHKTVEVYPDFVDSALQEAVHSGALRPLPPGVVPKVTSPIGVADNKAPKLRLIIDPAYVNLLLQYAPVRYEQLKDIASYAKPGDWATCTDEKSGYYHLPLHPSMWTHFGICWQGRYYVFTHMAFGIGPACRTYTALKQELFRVIRDRGGVRMTFLIDDQCNVAQGKLLAQFQAAAILRIQWALGFTLSLPKCQLQPTQAPHFLGMIVDLGNRKFVLPDEKVADFQRLVADLMGRPKVKARDLAKAAGKLVAFSPAIGLSKLYARHLFLIMQHMPLWDEYCPTPEAARDTLAWVAKVLPDWNGHRWESTRAFFRMAGDYSSECGYAAYSVDGHVLQVPMVMSLTDEERAAVSDGSLHSTFGELKCLVHLLTILGAEPHRERVEGRGMVYETDNIATYCTVMRMSGNAGIYPLVRAVHELAKGLDLELVVEWQRRSTPNQVEADRLSKLEDNSEWSLDDGVFSTRIAARPLVLGHPAGGLTIDLSASDSTTKLPRFMSRHYCVGTEGVDMFLRPSWATHPVTGARELCYINGDFCQMGRILAKIARDRADAVVVYPVWPRYWTVMWADLPVVDDFQLPSFPRICVPGPRVPRAKRQAWQARPRAPSYPLRVAVIIWPTS